MNKTLLWGLVVIVFLGVISYFVFGNSTTPENYVGYTNKEIDGNLEFNSDNTIMYSAYLINNRI